MKRSDVILCKFPHSSTAPAKVRPALVIDLSTPEGRQSGLKHNSLVSCINLAVIPPRNVDRKIGQLSETAMKQIDQCLKVALGIH